MQVLGKIGVFMLALLMVVGCSFGGEMTANALDTVEKQALTGFEEVAQYIAQHGTLPDNFITKAEARALGWDPQKGNLHEVAPGKSIGGDIFQNREGKLPSKNGRVWRECDINYKGGYRGSDRIVYSNDGLIYKTEDHYNTFERMR